MAPQAETFGLQSILTGIQNAAGGYGFTCALTNAGNVLCWGGNYYGQLGDGTSSGRAYPAPVGGLGTNIVGIATGGYSACAITTTGTLGFAVLGQQWQRTAWRRHHHNPQIACYRQWDERGCAGRIGWR